MVNKGSFFQRLKERLGSGSGVRVEPRNGGPRPRAGDRPVGSVPRVEPERHDEPREVASKLAPPVEARSQRKLSEREEALLTLGTHFQELTTMLRGSHARVDDQMSKLVAATSGLGALPGLSQQQLDMLQRMCAQLERQNALGEQVATTMTRLPSLLQNVEAALARAAATDERTATTVREFQATMDRIHGAMGQMVAHSDQQVKATQQLAERRDDALREVASGIEAAQQRAAAELQQTTAEGLQSLRRSHEDQANRLQRVVQEHAGWNRAVLVGIGLVVLGIGALIVLQLTR
jgi:septal ring factor EnvC (AmiA/AmiB activator)